LSPPLPVAATTTAVVPLLRLPILLQQQPRQQRRMQHQPLQQPPRPRPQRVLTLHQLLRQHRQQRQ